MNAKNSLVCLLVVLLILSVACEPFKVFEIRNDTPGTLEIWRFMVNDEHVLMNKGESLGMVEPGSAIRDQRFPLGYVILVEGKDESGNVVYSKYFNEEEMKKAKWKVVIPAGTP